MFGLSLPNIPLPSQESMIGVASAIRSKVFEVAEDLAAKPFRTKQSQTTAHLIADQVLLAVSASVIRYGLTRVFNPSDSRVTGWVINGISAHVASTILFGTWDIEN